jgi:quinoprotein glucose dehydrogenase
VASYLTRHVLPLIALSAACARPPDPEQASVDWPAYLGDKQSSHYSTLDQIDRGNVATLEIAWIHRTGDVWDPAAAQIQANPLVIDGVLYGTTPAVAVFALDAATGRQRWRFDPATMPGGDVTREARYLGANRGLAYWTDGRSTRLFVVHGSRLVAIDAATGSPVRGFGTAGAVDLREGLGRDVSTTYIGATTPGVVYRDLLVQGTRVGEGEGAAPGHVRAYDVRSGRVVWTFHTIPGPGDFGYDSWPPDAWRTVGGANSWAGMSLDEARGIVYVPTGSATPDFWGGERHGANLFANSLLALDAGTGERRWHFQTVHHDLWDRDLPAPPNLVTIERGGRAVDAVAQITKSGFVFVFDRVSGTSLFPIEERPVAPSNLPGDVAWPTQPVPVLPEPFARQTFGEGDINELDPETHAELLARFRQAVPGAPFVPFGTTETVLLPGFDGGGEWGGAAADPDGILYVNASEMPWLASMSPAGPVTAARGESRGAAVYRTRCAACHGARGEGDAARGVPAVEALEGHASAEDLSGLIRAGRGFMPAFPDLPDSDVVAVIGWLLGDDTLVDDVDVDPGVAEPAGAPFSFNGYHRFVDENGYPAIEPPWGTLNAIDLDTGAFVWRVPLGEIPALTARDVPITGTENYGGPIVTAGGLVFIAATRDEMFRAFDRYTGRMLWQTKLPAGGYATPATYMVDGRQFVVIAAGGGKMGTPSADYYVAFALPD